MMFNFSLKFKIALLSVMFLFIILVLTLILHLLFIIMKTITKTTDCYVHINKTVYVKKPIKYDIYF